MIIPNLAETAQFLQPIVVCSHIRHLPHSQQVINFEHHAAQIEMQLTGLQQLAKV